MKIYVSHCRLFDFQKELYEPIRKSTLNIENEIILPHEKSETIFNSKELFEEQCDLVIAEVSHQSTSVGIEMGWANILLIPIVCIYKEGSKPTDSIRAVTDTFIEYKDSDNLVAQLKELISQT